VSAIVETPKSRSRYSIRSLLALTAFAAMAIVIWQLYAELTPLRAELRRLRDEVGELTIEDETKLHAIAVRTDDEMTWKWRIWIPEGRKYKLYYSGKQIPEQGFAPSHGWMSLGEPGEHWIEYRIRREGGRWMDQLFTQSGSVGSSQQDWVAWGNKTTTGAGVYYSTQAFEPQTSVVLKRYRVRMPSDSPQIEDQTKGFMIWLEPVL
jgi:hypothetical protein